MYNGIMNDNYTKLIKACLPDALIQALVEKTDLDRKNVEYICLEVVARVFGDGSDLTKATILTKLKKVVSGEEIKNILERLENRFGIKASDSSKVLEQLLPLLFKRITSLDDTYFVASAPVVETSSQPIIEEKIVEEKPVEIKEPTVDEVYKNIEKKAEAQTIVKQEPKHSKRKSLLSKKEKKVISEDTIQDEKENTELSLIDKICTIVVGVAFIALIVTIAILFIKQNI